MGRGQFSCLPVPLLSWPDSTTVFGSSHSNAMHGKGPGLGIIVKIIMTEDIPDKFLETPRDPLTKVRTAVLPSACKWLSSQIRHQIDLPFLA